MAVNLDYQAVRIAQEVIKQAQENAGKGYKLSDVENLITKTLGVLQENGVYACMLYLFSRNKSEKVVSEIIWNKLFDGEILAMIDSSAPFDKKKDVQKTFEFLSNEICSRLDTLLFVKRLWEQILIYARYGAKAGGI